MAMFVWKPWRLHNFCRVCGVLCYSARTTSAAAATCATTGTTTSSSSAASDSLYGRVSRAGHPRTSMIQILEQWLQEGRSVKQDELRCLITRLRSFRRFKHALQVSEWMCSIRSMNFSRRDFAVHLDLTAKVHGIDRAEEYFETIPCYMRAPQSYGALLNCYAYSKSVEKAEAIMQKFKEFGLDRRPYPYNAMLKLYFRLERYDEMDNIMRQMEERGILFDNLTYSIRLNAFVVTGDVKGMESFVAKMEVDPSYTLNWRDYVLVANGYVQAGVFDKAIVTLNRAERLAIGVSKKIAYHNLLTMYARAKSADDVYRLWDAYKGLFDVHNKGYTCMVSSLIILGDLEGAEMIAYENLSRSKDVEFFATNLLLRAYFEQGEVEKAEALVNRAISYGKEPRAFTWHILATGYCKHSQMGAATKAMKKALMSDDPGGQKLDKSTLTACLDYLRVKGDSKELEEFRGLLDDSGCNSETSSIDHCDMEDIVSDVDEHILDV
ncbi:hypothetical protein Dimus_009575 [Dionaea muscipula]